jgi:transposase
MGTTRVENHPDQAVRPTYEELWEENRRLKRQVEKLTRLVEKLSREGRRQAAPFRKQDQPQRKPSKPGRKSGRRHGRHTQRDVPPRIDENYDVPLPERCPHCGEQHVNETHVVVQYQTEIPRTVIYRQFDIHVGRCKGCGRAVQGRHELQTSAACGAAASQLGPNVHAAFTILNKQLGLSHGKSVRLLTTLFHALREVFSRACDERPLDPAHGQTLSGGLPAAPAEPTRRVRGRA